MLRRKARDTDQELQEDLEKLQAGQKSLFVKHLSIEQFVELIEEEPGFSFARISDGGFFCLQGRRGYNCDGVAYSREQADALTAMLKDPTIYHGITSIAIHVAHAAEWLHSKGIKVDWYDADVMNKASDEGKLFPFIECLRRRKIVFCGPSHLFKLGGFRIQKFVECHPSEAFEEVDELEAEISYHVGKINADTVLLSAGQGAAPTLVSRLHRLHPELVVLDTGSIWDPYVHVFSRSGHKRRGWEEYKRLGWLNFKMSIENWQ
jgi:hypothetical protein